MVSTSPTLLTNRSEPSGSSLRRTGNGRVWPLAMDGGFSTLIAELSGFLSAFVSAAESPGAHDLGEAQECQGGGVSPAKARRPGDEGHPQSPG